MEIKVAELLNEQINKEMFSAYLYLDIENYFSEQGLDGFAHWYMLQASEEMEHAMKIYNYLHEEEEKITLEAIAKPDCKFKNNREPLEAALKHEKFITDSIHAIYEAAEEVKDYRTMRFLDWFVTEQAEEEVNANELLTKYDLFGDDARSLYLLNGELKGRA